MPTPKISIIIPTKNRVQKLRSCVNSILRSNYLQDDFEIVIVNDGSVDETFTYLQQLVSDYPCVKVIHQDSSGPAAARNRGISCCRGEILAFTDDDCIVDKNWLKNIDQEMYDSNIKAIGGRVHSLGTDTISCYMEYIHALDPGLLFDGTVMYLATANACFHRSLFEEVGFFDDRYLLPGGEDMDFSLKLRSAGTQLNFSSKFRVYHCYENSPRDFINRYFRYGYGGRIAFNKYCCEKQLFKELWIPESHFQVLNYFFGDVDAKEIRSFYEINDIWKRFQFSILDLLRSISYLLGYLNINSIDYFMDYLRDSKVKYYRDILSDNYVKSASSEKTQTLLALITMDNPNDIVNSEHNTWLRNLISEYKVQPKKTLKSILNFLDFAEILKYTHLKSKNIGDHFSLPDDCITESLKEEWFTQLDAEYDCSLIHYIQILEKLLNQPSYCSLNGINQIYDEKRIPVDDFLIWLGEVLGGYPPQLIAQEEFNIYQAKLDELTPVLLNIWSKGDY